MSEGGHIPVLARQHIYPSKDILDTFYGRVSPSNVLGQQVGRYF